MVKAAINCFQRYVQDRDLFKSINPNLSTPTTPGHQAPNDTGKCDMDLETEEAVKLIKELMNETYTTEDPLEPSYTCATHHLPMSFKNENDSKRTFCKHCVTILEEEVAEQDLHAPKNLRYCQRRGW